MAVLECGCDEVGRGSAIGEIYAGAVILDERNMIKGLRDSKKLTAKKRKAFTEEIKNKALAWSVAKVSLEEIARLNVHRASLLAMKRAVEALALKPHKVLVDGKYPLDLDIANEAVIDGDDKIAAISAASIIAKVTRDEAMLAYHELYPVYAFDKNKGYLTKAHFAALAEYGPCPVHRMFYAPIRNQIKRNESPFFL